MVISVLPESVVIHEYMVVVSSFLGRAFSSEISCRDFDTRYVCFLQMFYFSTLRPHLIRVPEFFQIPISPAISDKPTYYGGEIPKKLPKSGKKFLQPPSCRNSSPNFSLPKFWYGKLLWGSEILSEGTRIYYRICVSRIPREFLPSEKSPFSL